MSNVIWLIETIFLFIFSYIVPKNKNLIIFWSMKWIHISWNPKIFYLYLNSISKWKLNLYFFDWYKTNIDNRIKVYWFWFKKYWLILRAKYLIIDACSFDLWVKWVIFWHFNLIQMWHWEPIKKIWFLSDLYIKRRNKIILFFEKLEYKTYKMILSNPWTSKIIEWAFQSKKVFNIWFPRNDILLNKQILKLVENYIVKNKITEYKKVFNKIILLAPTFREKNNTNYFSLNEIKKLNEILVENNYIILIKKHINEKRDFLNNNIFSNIIDITNKLNYDSTDFLPFIDIIITDYSSIYIDFLLTNKPIIWYQNDLHDYINKERWLIYNQDKIIIPDTTAYNINDLCKIIWELDFITKKESYIKNYNKLYNLFYKWLIKKSTTCKKIYNLMFK